MDPKLFLFFRGSLSVFTGLGTLYELSRRDYSNTVAATAGAAGSVATWLLIGYIDDLVTEAKIEDAQREIDYLSSQDPSLF